MAEDAITLITRDHREMEQLFEQLRTDEASRPTVLAQVGAMLLAHSRAEEERVYPEIVAISPGDKEEVHHGAQEHVEAEQILHRLERTDPTGDEFETVLAELVEAVQHHVQEEESEILPALAKAVRQATLVELGRAFMERREQELSAYGPGGEAAAGTSAGAGGSAADASKSELYEKAREAGIEGRSTMDKDELIQVTERKR